MTQLTRILVIGADAADVDLIERWGAVGDLPNLMALRTRGAYGRTQNPHGMVSGSVWPAFHTGAMPGEQPQYDAMRYFDPQRYAFDFYKDSDIGEPIWRQLSQAGRRCFVMDAPYTHIEPSINGVCVVDWSSHVPSLGTGTLELRSAPATAAQEILDLVGSDPAHGVMCDDRLCETIAEYRRFIAQHLDRIEKKGRAAAHFLRKGGWDYFEICFSDLHCMGHHLWHINDPGHPRYRADFEAALGEPLREGYRALDRAIGELLRLVDDETLTVLFASHGMGPQYTGTGLLDRILFNLEHGIRSEGSGRTVKGRLRALWRSVPPDVRAAVMPIKKHFSGALLNSTFINDRATRKFFEVYVDNSEGGVRLNLKGREANGLVDPQDADKLLKWIAEELTAVVNIDTNEPLVQEVVRVSEHYRGPHLDHLPDLTIMWNKSHPIRAVRSERIGTIWQEFADARTGDHKPDGYFIAAGGNVQRGALNSKVSVTDFVPTFRSVLGLPAGPTSGTVINAIARLRDARVSV